jgi:hypothetical protein
MRNRKYLIAYHYSGLCRLQKSEINIGCISD